MFRIISASITTVLLLFALGCGNSDSWLSRQWHNTNAHYNVYFNAEESWKSTVLSLRENYTDDYRSFIELYNYGSAESLKGNQGTMDDVVKRVSTLIDKHPKSRWVDDAYLLMAKAYFMKGDFFAAKDIFEFVNTSFKDPIIQYQSRLWVFQCLYYQGKLGEAESLVNSLKNDKEFPVKLLPELNKALGAIYLRKDKPSQAIEPLLICLDGTKPKMDRYRLHFALGQAFQKIEKYDEAEMHFAKVVKMNPPYEMAFNARINQVEILSLKKGEYNKANIILKKMLKDDKNIDYYAQIYYRMGKNELRAGNNIKGLEFLNQSLQNSKRDAAQATTTYITLGDYYYGGRDFERAGLYYDSANNLLDEKHPDYASISKKSLLLSELLRHLITIRKQDSLIKLADDPILREKVIDKLIEDEKKGISKGPSNIAGGAPNNTPGGGLNGTQNIGSFPFYNATNRARGAAEFQTYWGNRENRDYWRIKSKSTGGTDLEDTATLDVIDTNANGINNVAENRKKYYKEIPLTPSARKESLDKIETALMGAAGVYQNSFNEPASAIFYYKELLNRFPKTRFEAQALYEIAKLMRNAGNTAEYEKYRKALSDKYPESTYLKLLDDPNAANNISDEGPVVAKKEIQDLYESMYNAYKTDSFENALAIKSRADAKYAGNNLQAKFDYLAALCLIRMGQTEVGIEKLTQVVIDYPDSPEAKEAQATIDIYNLRKNPLPVEPDTAIAGGVELWKTWDGAENLQFLITYPRGANSNLIRSALSDFSKENFIFENLEIGPPQSLGETIYFTVSNFTTPDVCKQYLEFMKSKPDFFSSKGLYEYELVWISDLNYTTLLNNKRINSYLEFFRGKI